MPLGVALMSKQEPESLLVGEGPIGDVGRERQDIVTGCCLCYSGKCNYRLINMKNRKYNR